MEFDYRQLIPSSFSDEAKVWIYQADRRFSDEEVHRIREQLTQFNEQWNSHGAKVKSYVNLLLSQFIILMLDGTSIQIAGCSIDSSTNFIHHLEKEFDVSLFDRQALAFKDGDDVRMIPLRHFEKAFNDGIVGKDTLYFDNTVLTKGDFIQRWLTPVGKSWLNNRIHA